MPIQELPQEILEHLVDCTTDDSESTLSSLKSLALTSPRFVERCQSYLFSGLQINLDIPRAVRDIFEQKPSLFRHVKELDLSIDPVNPPAYELSIADRKPTLYRVIDELQDLAGIRICFSPPSRWSAASPLCQSVVAKLLGHPVHRLTLVNISGLPLHLAHPALINTVEKCWIIDSSFDLTALQQTWKAAVLSRDSSPFDNIVNLHLNGEFGDLIDERFSGSLPPLLQSCSRLKVLTLEYPSDIIMDAFRSNFDRESLRIPTIPSLRYLHIHLSTEESAGRGQSVSPVIPRFLRALLPGTAQPALEILDIKISWTVYPPPIVFPDFMQPFSGSAPLLQHAHDWGALDEALSNTTLYPKLHAVRFTPDVHFYIPDDSDAFALKMPGLFEEEVTAVMASTRARPLIFHAGGEETEAGEAFKKAVESILEAHKA